MAEVTLKSTKAEIMEAYKAAKAEHSITVH